MSSGRERAGADAFLYGLLWDLERYCTTVRERLGAADGDQEVRDQALDAYQVVEGIRREVRLLLADPDLGTPDLQPNYHQLYRRWREGVALVESYPLLFVERYSASDRQMTRLCRRIAEQVRWPLAPPLVATFSTQYYWTVTAFNVVCAPATEGTTLLSLPDLLHELGHILLLHHEAALVGDFVQEIATYIAREQRRIDTQQRPPHYRSLYDDLFAHWRSPWLREFVADMVATYLCGSAFGWQHVRLCASVSRAAYAPTLGEASDHPADEARLRGIVAVLQRVGDDAAQARVRDVWERYRTMSGETQPSDYEVCYPQELINSLAERVVDGCRSLGLRGVNDTPATPDALLALINEAWERFQADPEHYGDWEYARLRALWEDLGVADGRP